MSGNTPEEQYIKKGHKRLVYIALFLLIGIAISFYSLGAGYDIISLNIALEAIQDYFNGKTYTREEDYWKWLTHSLILDGTVPRAFGGMLIGAILGISGAIMQMCVRNPLASPYTTGISSAALFGVTIYLTLGILIIPIKGDFGMMINAFIFSMIPCMVMILISIRKKTTPTMLVLIGIGIMYLFNALTMILKYRAEPEVLRQIQIWSIGTLNGIDWEAVWVLALTTALLLVFIIPMMGQLDLLSAGDNFSQSLGVNPGRTRMLCMLVISAATAISVCYAGSIGFVGLIIPHVSRLFVGSKSSLLIPCSAVLGGVLLIGSDVISRIMTLSLPVGAVTALIGAPLFLYFLIKMRTSGWGK